MSKIQVDEIYDKEGTGAPSLPNGAVVTGVLTATSYDGGDINSSGNINSVGNINATGVVTSTAFYGDGSNLSGVTLGSSVNINTTGIITATSFSGDGSGLVFAPKIIAFDPAALSTGAAIGTNITITFDQNIYFSGSGTIEIRQGSAAGTITTSFAISSGTPATGLNISGTQLIINPADNLPQGTNNYVVLPSSGIANTEGISYAGSNNYNFQTEAEAFTAQGGDVELNLADPTSPTGYYKYHIFTTSGILTTSQSTVNADSFSFMMIGGGGGGGNYTPYPISSIGGGGGGAGGYIAETGPTLALLANSYTVTIGAGGPGGTPTGSSTNGTETSLISPTYTLIAYGSGGGGGTPNPPSGRPGASGGGGAHNGGDSAPFPGGGGITGQGNPGGIGRGTYTYPTGPSTPVPSAAGAGGGGGGAGASGSDGNIFGGPTNLSYGQGGAGGNGLQNPAFVGTTLQPHISPTIMPTNSFINLGPTSNYWAGGGSGGSNYINSGGFGGGGNTRVNFPVTSPSLPTNSPFVPNPTTLNPSVPADGGQNTGGGGGGAYSSYSGGNGGAGVLMIRYAAPASA